MPTKEHQRVTWVCAGAMREPAGEVRYQLLGHEEMRIWDNEAVDCGGVSVFHKDQVPKPQKQVPELRPAKTA